MNGRRRLGEWLPIETAPRDGSSVLVFVSCAEVPIIRLAFWDDGEAVEESDVGRRDAARGWWSYDNSVSQTKLEDPVPTHWMRAPDPPGD